VGCPEQYGLQFCNTHSCPVDCHAGPFGDWGDCSKTCGGGEKMKKRIIFTEPQFGGKECPQRNKTKSCNKKACPVDCEIGTYTEWSTCTATCGGGSRTKTRPIIKQAANGGHDCPPPFLLEFIEDCNSEECAQDCVMGEWSPFMPCEVTCGGGHHVRFRSEITPSLHGGIKCGPTIETQECGTAPCPVDCEYSDWYPWSGCSVTCGDPTTGHRKRSREITRPAEGGGVPCTEHLHEYDHGCKDVKVPDCPVVCDVEVWNDWSECSATCGGGKKTRSIDLTKSKSTAHPDKPCNSHVDTEPCNTHECPIVHCVIGDWDEWFACSASCGGGTHTRTRLIVTAAENGGDACVNTEESAPCDSGACPEDCMVGAWNSWTTCTTFQYCNGGIQTRSRTIMRYPEVGGEACPKTEDSQPCDENMCPGHCKMSVWTAWSKCDAPCGTSGHKSRSRSIQEHPQGTGHACPPTEETVVCLEKCPRKKTDPWKHIYRQKGGWRAAIGHTWAVNEVPEYGEYRVRFSHAPPAADVVARIEIDGEYNLPVKFAAGSATTSTLVYFKGGENSMKVSAGENSLPHINNFRVIEVHAGSAGSGDMEQATDPEMP
jgi:hypothetical protein